MTPAEWQRVKEIAAEALARADGERASYVAARCGADAALALEVRSLLESVATADALYEGPSLTTAGALAAFGELDAPGGSIVGGRIGAYRVLSEIGRGGMGAAYLAVRDDQVYEKRVAIKLIKRGMDTDAILRRFRRERQILADLDHPNIVTLLDGGTTDDGLPYFIMEYVDGLPIDRYCEANGLSIAARLKLFQDVCGAVHHAHERRVLHRDLKPSNILVTSAGVPKLLDFGIATLLDADHDDHPGEPTSIRRAMTPQYASPEQLRGGALTAASDVYALGVLLYVLLSGRLPYRLEGRSTQDVERLVCDETPPKPSTTVDGQATWTREERPDRLRRLLSGDLDTITMTALQKEPERRYAAASALAEDVQRHLEGRPIAARSDRFLARLAARVRRRRALAGSRAGAPVGTAPPAPPRRPTAAWVSLMVGFALIAALAVTAVYRGRSSASAAEARAIAVLPLANASGDADLDYLSEGITEDLINRLSRVPHLKVMARDSAYRYRGAAADPQQIGRELGVEAIVTGRIVRHGTALSITAELIDTRDRRLLWGDRYERPLGSVQSLQTELAQQIASGLRLRFSPAEHALVRQLHTRDGEAYQLYLKGRYFWNKRTASGFQSSIRYFTQAIDKDPSFALAHSGLADSYSLLTEYHAAPAVETYPKVKHAITRALELDDALAEAHVSSAYMSQFYEWDWEAAGRAFRRSLALNPSYATGRQWYAEHLSALGRHDEALTEIRKAEALDPLSLIVNAVEANLLYMARQYDRAIEQCLKVIELDPNFPEVYEYLKRSYDQKGMYKEAIAARQQRRRILGKTTTETPALRAAASAASAREYWQKRLEQELEEARDEGLQPFEFAEILAQAGETARALDWLDRACTEHDFMMLYVGVAPNLDPLRSEPRFKQIVARRCGV
jgi:serine/threonine protein kinase/TolB-like protein/Tfp pilus assembly protein PilF